MNENVFRNIVFSVAFRVRASSGVAKRIFGVATEKLQKNDKKCIQLQQKK